MHWLTVYLLAGLATFWGLRAAFRKAKIDSKPHWMIWISCLTLPEGWFFAILLWPLLAVASLGWFVAGLFHESGMKEIQRREEIEARRDKKYDHMTLDQKIELLEIEAKKRK